MSDPIAWSKEGVRDFIKQVAPPGEKLSGFDDRITYDDAIKLAEYLGEDGHELMTALSAMSLQEVM